MTLITIKPSDFSHKIEELTRELIFKHSWTCKDAVEFVQPYVDRVKVEVRAIRKPFDQQVKVIYRLMNAEVADGKIAEDVKATLCMKMAYGLSVAANALKHDVYVAALDMLTKAIARETSGCW